MKTNPTQGFPPFPPPSTKAQEIMRQTLSLNTGDEMRVPLYTYSMWILSLPHSSDVNVIIEKEFEALEL